MEKDLYKLFKEKKFQEVINALNHKDDLDEKLQNLKALCFYALDNVDTAKEIFYNLVKSNNHFTDPYINLGKLLFSEHKFEESLVLFEKANKINPSLSITNIYLAQIKQKKGLLKEAEKHFQSNVNLEPLNYMHYNNLGAFYYSDYQFNKSILQFKKSLQIKNNFTALKALGDIYVHLNEINVSLKYYLDFLKFKKDPDILYKVGLNYFFIGKKEEGISFLKEALFYNPTHSKSILYLSRINELTEDQCEKIKLYYEKQKNILEKSNLGFALFNYHNHKKNYSIAINYLNEANKLVYDSIKNKNLFNYELEFNIYKKVFNSKNQVVKNHNQNKNNRPVFILGMPRSGSTLVEQILSNHSSISSFGEVNYLDLSLSKTIKQLDLNLYESKLKETISNQGKIEEIREKYLSFFNSTNGIYFTDKMLNNFRYIGLIKTIFPESKIIYIKRNIKDNCFSIYANHFGSEPAPWVYDKNELVQYYKLHVDLMNYWFKIYGDTICKVNYEDLVQNIEIEAKKIINYLNLNWEEDCLKFNKSVQAAKTISSNQVRNKLYKSSIDLWKVYDPYLDNFFELMD